jgi:hypothetical protein|tara:strand:+ start:4035 stop:4331 length:297 start_codon:yes stop_codon:yes gene_type:complete
MNIGGINTPFDDCDSDSQSIDTSGGTLAALFTNLTLTKCRGVSIQNRGSANVRIGSTAATARFNILPGATYTAYAKDLAKIAIIAASGTQTVDIFVAI